MEENPNHPDKSREPGESDKAPEPQPSKPNKPSPPPKRRKSRKPRKPGKPRKSSVPRKPHPNSKLRKLPEEVQVRIADWCAQDSFAAAVQRCANELSPSLKITASQLCVWYKRWRKDAPVRERKLNLKEIFERADANAKAVAEKLKEHGATEEQMARASQLVFTLQAVATEDIKLFIDLEKLRLARDAAVHKAEMDAARLEQKQAELALAERRVAVLEARLAEIKDTVEDKALSDEERAQAIRDIYGRI